MPLFRMLANQAYAELAPCTTTTDSNAVDFGFPATRVQVQNDRAAAVYISVNSTAPSTGGIRTCSGESHVITGIPISCVAVASTTTSTGTIVRVSGIGG